MLSGHIIPTFEAVRHPSSDCLTCQFHQVSSKKNSRFLWFLCSFSKWLDGFLQGDPRHTHLCESVLTDCCADSRALEMQTYHPALAYCTVILFAKQSVYWHQSQARVPQWLRVVVGDLLHGNGVSGTESPLCSSSTLGCCDHGRSDRGPLFHEWHVCPLSLCC